MYKNTTKGAITLYLNNYKLWPKQKRPMQRKMAKFDCLYCPDNTIVSFTFIGNLYISFAVYSWTIYIPLGGGRRTRAGIWGVYTRSIIRNVSVSKRQTIKRDSFPGTSRRRFSSNINKRTLHYYTPTCVCGRELVYNEHRVSPCSIFPLGRH